MCTLAKGHDGRHAALNGTPPRETYEEWPNVAAPASLPGEPDWKARAKRYSAFVTLLAGYVEDGWPTGVLLNEMLEREILQLRADIEAIPAEAP